MSQPINKRCGTCRFWQADTSGGGPFEPKFPGDPDSKRARACKRFPPTGLWGVTPDAQSYGIGKSLLTFEHDWCGEHQPREDQP